MSNLEIKLQLLKTHTLQMMRLVKDQLKKGSETFFAFDEELAHTIRKHEKEVDAFELRIDQECEHIFALFNPVAVDLRLVMAIYKISADLERVGDNVHSIANYILDMGVPVNEQAVKMLRLDEMFEVSIEMMECVIKAFETENGDLARQVFKTDKLLNEINRKASSATAQLIVDDEKQIHAFLYLFTMVRKLERIGDMAKNIAEEIVFYTEAKVLKHTKKPD